MTCGSAAAAPVQIRPENRHAKRGFRVLFMTLCEDPLTKYAARMQRPISAVRGKVTQKNIGTKLFMP